MTPVDCNGVGYSDYTHIKQEFLEKFIRMNLRVWKSVIGKCEFFQGNYTYFDITAGPGWHEVYGAGSPIIFLKEVNQLGMRYCAHFWDKNPETIINLRINIAKKLGDIEHYYYTRIGDHKKLLTEWSNQQYKPNKVPGLLYCDLNAEIPPFDELASFASKWSKVDILINYAGTTPKRRSCELRTRTSEYMEKIGKHRKQCMIREPISAHQWTFLFFTNGPVTEWKRMKFVDINSRSGVEYLRRIDYAKNENPDQPTLPNLSGIPTPP